MSSLTDCQQKSRFLRHNGNMKNKFKTRLRELRLEKKLTQQELSNLLGFGRTTVNEWEIKGNEPNIDTLIRIAKFFDVSLDYLVGLED